MSIEIVREGKSVGIKSLFRLAGPIFAANLALVCSGTIDTIMAGRRSADDLAGVALGIAVATWISISLAGILQGISPIAGYAYGAKKYREVGHALVQCVYLAIALSIPGVWLTAQTDLWMSFSEVTESVSKIACDYLLYAAAALPAILIGRAFVAVNAAVSRPAASMVVTLGIVILKAPANWLFMEYFGLGGAGVGVSLFVLSWLALIAYVAIWELDPYYKNMHGERFASPSFSLIEKQLRIGIPIGLSIFFEMTSYTLMALFIARLGAVVLAAHQIVANLVWLYYVIPFAIGVAGTVLVSQNLGANRPDNSYRATVLVMKIALGAALVVSLLTLFFREEIAALYTSDEDVRKTALAFITVVAWYHIADAVQCSGACVLRGYRITLIPMLVHSFLLCGVGLSFGYYLSGFVEGAAFSLGGLAFWIGASVGLTAAAVIIGPFTLIAAARKAGFSFFSKPHRAGCDSANQSTGSSS